MDDDQYAEGYSDGQADARALYDPASWKGYVTSTGTDYSLPKWVPPTDERVPINIHPEARDRLHAVLANDSRFQGIGYSQFIMMALDLLAED